MGEVLKGINGMLIKLETGGEALERRNRKNNKHIKR
jgi:hypothetical protein